MVLSEFFPLVRARRGHGLETAQHPPSPAIGRKATELSRFCAIGNLNSIPIITSVLPLELVKKWGQAPRSGVIVAVPSKGKQSQSPLFHKPVVKRYPLHFQ